MIHNYAISIFCQNNNNNNNKIKEEVIPYLSKCNMCNCTENCNKCTNNSFTLRYVLYSIHVDLE